MAKFIAYPNLSQEKALDAFLEAHGIAFKKLPETDLPRELFTGVTQGEKGLKDDISITAEDSKKK